MESYRIEADWLTLIWRIRIDLPNDAWLALHARSMRYGESMLGTVRGTQYTVRESRERRVQRRSQEWREYVDLYRCGDQNLGPKGHENTSQIKLMTHQCQALSLSATLGPANNAGGGFWWPPRKRILAAGRRWISALA